MHHHYHRLLACFFFFFSAIHASQAEPVKHSATRIISADASATEIVLALGLGQSLIAIDVTSQLPADFPALPSIGYHRNLSAEGLLSLNPDMVIGSDHIGPANIIPTLKQAGVSWVQLYNATNAEQLLQNIDRVGQATQQITQATALRQQVERQLQQLQQQTGKNIKMAFLLQRGSTLRLAGAHTGGDALISLLGGDNVADYQNYRSVSAESLLALQPDVILYSVDGAESSDNALLEANPALQHSKAAQRQQVLAVNGSDLVAGLSLAAVNTAERLMQQLQTEP